MGLSDAERDQRMAALDLANQVRRERKKLKRRLSVGQEDARQLIERPPQLIHTAPVGQVLRWLPKVGQAKATRILRELPLAPSVPMGRLSDFTRRRIVERLPQS